MARTQTVVPQLRMLDSRASIPFYVDGLGFAIDWEHRFEPHMPLFAQLSRDGQTIFLSEHGGDGQPGGAVFFWVPDADACHAAFAAAGIASMRAPEDTPWGTREFIVIDPSHNQLRFATDR